MRHQNQSSTAAEIAPIIAKMSRHEPNSRIVCPTVGASTGAAMKTMKARLITRAIARPE